MPSENLFLSLLLLLLLALLLPNARHLRLTNRSRQHQPRSLLPRSPRDCPLCCQPANTPAATRPLMPWSQCKSSRGRPKSIPTAGQYCPNPGCDYFRIRAELLLTPI